MKDTIGQEINDGDLVFQTNYDRMVLGLVQGGFTKGGKVRYISCFGYKQNSHSHNLLVIPRELAQTFINERIEWVDRQIENYGEQDEDHLNNYYTNMKARWQEAIDAMFEKYDNK